MTKEMYTYKYEVKIGQYDHQVREIETDKKLVVIHDLKNPNTIVEEGQKPNQYGYYEPVIDPNHYTPDTLELTKTELWHVPVTHVPPTSQVRYIVVFTNRDNTKHIVVKGSQGKLELAPLELYIDQSKINIQTYADRQRAERAIQSLVKLERYFNHHTTYEIIKMVDTLVQV